MKWFCPTPALMVATCNEDGLPDVMDAAWGGTRVYRPLAAPLAQAFIDTETEVAADRKTLILKSRPDDSCVYLTDDNRCRIHPVKPDKCRTFPFEWTNADSHEVCPALRIKPAVWWSAGGEY